MKKVIETFICDECGAPLPSEFIVTGPDGTSRYDSAAYNKILLGKHRDAETNAHLSLTVSVDYVSDKSDLCPVCRLEWLKKVLSALEGELARQKTVLPLSDAEKTLLRKCIDKRQGGKINRADGGCLYIEKAPIIGFGDAVVLRKVEADGSTDPANDVIVPFEAARGLLV